MKKVLVLILTLLAMTGIANADLIVDGADWSPTLGWMNITATEGNWGSGWGVSDLRANEINGYWTLQTNINGSADNPNDPYWAPGHIIMEANSYTEVYGLSGQNVTFNFEIGSNDLAGALDASGSTIVTEAFIKTLDADGTWATTQEIYEALTVGTHSISIENIDPSLANPVVQFGFRVISSTDAAGSSTADLGAVIVPEPATLALFGIGGLLLRRRK